MEGGGIRGEKQRTSSLTNISELHQTMHLDFTVSKCCITSKLAEVVSHTVDSLMEQLPSDEKPELEGPIPPPGEKVLTSCPIMFICSKQCMVL